MVKTIKTPDSYQCDYCEFSDENHKTVSMHEADIHPSPHRYRMIRECMDDFRKLNSVSTPDGSLNLLYGDHVFACSIREKYPPRVIAEAKKRLGIT